MSRPDFPDPDGFSFYRGIDEARTSIAAIHHVMDCYGILEMDRTNHAASCPKT
jgi:hypothetical protein